MIIGEQCFWDFRVQHSLSEVFSLLLLNFFYYYFFPLSISSWLAYAFIHIFLALIPVLVLHLCCIIYELCERVHESFNFFFFLFAFINLILISLLENRYHEISYFLFKIEQILNFRWCNLWLSFIFSTFWMCCPPSWGDGLWLMSPCLGSVYLCMRNK